MSTDIQVAEPGELNIAVYGEMLRRTSPKVIKTLAENRRAVALLNQLLDQGERTPEEEALVDLLAGLIDAFERTAFASPTYTPRERLQFLLDENGMKAADIAELMGGASLVSLALSGKREISKEQARKLGERFFVPPAFFIY